MAHLSVGNIIWSSSTGRQFCQETEADFEDLGKAGALHPTKVKLAGTAVLFQASIKAHISPLPAPRLTLLIPLGTNNYTDYHGQTLLIALDEIETVRGWMPTAKIFYRFATAWFGLVGWLVGWTFWPLNMRNGLATTAGGNHVSGNTNHHWREAKISL